MHNYIWCPYYLPSFMKFCSVVSEELRWQTVMDRRTAQKQYVSPQKWGWDIITSHMQKSIQIYPCLLKLSRKQESVTDGQTDSRYYYIPSLLSRGIIKQQWTIEEISIFSNSSHLEWRAGLSDTILKRTHPRTIPARFGLIWFRGFRGEDLNV
jgi:hypothetical protein